MYTFVTILIIIVCVLLALVVLIQNPKGGGVNASLSGVGQQLLGARRSTDVVEKLTWGFAFALIFLCLSTSFFVNKNAAVKSEKLPESDIANVQKTKAPGGFNIPAAGANQQPQNQPTAPTGK
jgi:preprotein translocase subunit SecG